MISKKLLTINIIVLVLLIVAHTLGNYLILYPMRFDFWEVIETSKPQYLLVALAFFALISWLVSHLRIRKMSPENRFLLIFTILCAILLLYISYYDITTFFKTKDNYY